ncbi:MAG: ATP-binding protein, partial [Desulfovibrionales bacterium]|nr:ATP-binding protein [Desulfovibrionales bacterium]
MRNEFIVTQRVTAFREAVSVLEDTVKGQPGIMLVWGHSGRGKSSCVEKYATDTGALYVYVESEDTPLVLLKRILWEL